MGFILAGEVFRTFPKLKPVPGGPLRVRRQVVELPLPEVTPEQIQKAKEVAARTGKRDATRTSFMETVEAFKVLDVVRREGRPLEVEVQVVTLGNEIAWVSLPGEVFVELGLALKQDSPFPCTIIAELANGSIGYIPSRRAYPQGNYEVVSARCAEGSGELLVETAVELLKDIYTANLNAGAE
jgi:neutral ceramidase